MQWTMHGKLQNMSPARQSHCLYVAQSSYTTCCSQDLAIEGQANLSAAVQIAQLALKHRQNKNQRQRIVIFIGSPIAEDKVRVLTASVKPVLPE